MNTENHYQETDLGNISLNPRGEYNPEESYEYLDLVVLEGGSYVCLAENGATITGISPESGKTTQYWQVITIPGSLTPEYIAMYDRVVNLSEQVGADAEEVRTAEQNVSGMELNVTQMQEQTRQSAEAAEQSKDSAAGYASSADTSRQAAEESEQNINAQITGFDVHVAEKTEEAENDIEAARIAANKAIIAQQEQSVNEVARAGIEAISTAQSAAQTATEKAQAAATSEKNAAASETAAKLSEANATKMAEQVAADKEQVAYDRTAVENAKQEMTESSAQIEKNTQGIAELKSDLFGFLKNIEINVDYNLLDDVITTENVYPSWVNGVNTIQEGYFSTDFIYIRGIKAFTFSGVTSNVNSVCFYDKNKNFISGNYKTTSYSVPDDAYYLKFGFLIVDKANITFTLKNEITELNDEITALNDEVYDVIPKLLDRNVVLDNISFPIKGKYYSWDTGALNGNANYESSDLIRIIGDIKIDIDSNDSIKGSYSFFDKDKVFISGTYNKNSIISPSNACYIGVSKGKTSYLHLTLHKKCLEKQDNIIVVDKNGNGDFTTINSALSYAYTIESIDNPITIYINTGIYEEVLFIQGQHYVSLIGKNRNDCVIRDDTALYNNAPLRIQGQCYVANLSFISTADKYSSDTGTGKEAWKTDVLNGVANPSWLGTIASYAVHCDDVTNGEHTVSRFENCYMYSETFPAFGSGMQLDNTIELIGCELITNIDEDVFNAGKGNMQGTLSVHGKFPSEPVSEPKQKLFVKDCYIEGVNSRCVNMYPSENAPKASITFINNTFMNNHCKSLNDLVSFTFDTQYIEKCSNGNNLDFFNRTLLESNT